MVTVKILYIIRFMKGLNNLLGSINHRLKHRITLMNVMLLFDFITVHSRECIMTVHFSLLQVLMFLFFII